MNEIERGQKALESIFTQAKRKNELTGYVGIPNGAGGYTIYAPYMPGYVYVRMKDVVGGSIALAINGGVNLDPAIEVEMERIDGLLVIRRAVAAHAAQVYGTGAPLANLPPVQQATPGYSAKEGGALSLLGTNGAALGGLVVRITPYRHRGGYWEGTTTITLVPTATANHRAWVCVGINTKTNTITQALTANRGVGFTPFPRSDVDPILNANPDVDWRAAVNLANGETSIDVGDIISLMSHGETKPKNNFSATAAPGVGDDIDDGYGVGSRWTDTTNDNVWECTDGTAGAAVWKQLNNTAASVDLTGLTELTTVDGANDLLLIYDNSAGTNKKLKPDNLGVGGGLTHTYVGYNTVGGSNTALLGGTAYMKKITLASAGWLGSIGVYIDHTASTNVQSLSAWVLSDNAGTPNLIIAVGPYLPNPSFFINTTARWVDIAMGVYLPAGDYWLVVQRPVDSGTDLRIYYDGSGSDKTQAIGNAWNADGSLYTISSTSNQYSIRGSILT